MAEQSVKADEPFVPTPWWCEYKCEVNGVLVNGFAIGWIDPRQNMDADLQFYGTYVSVNGSSFEGSDIRAFWVYRSDIIREGPLMMGHRMTKEEFEAYQAQQKALADAASAHADECKSGERRSAEMRNDHDWGV